MSYAAVEGVHTSLTHTLLAAGAAEALVRVASLGLQRAAREAGSVLSPRDRSLERDMHTVVTILAPDMILAQVRIPPDPTRQ